MTTESDCCVGIPDCNCCADSAECWEVKKRTAATSNDPTGLAEIIAEKLYDAANEHDDGPGGGLPWWTTYTNDLIMPAFREYVAARDAELRKQIADEIWESARNYAIGARTGLGIGDAVPLPEPMRHYEQGMRTAAVIARGEA